MRHDDNPRRGDLLTYHSMRGPVKVRYIETVAGSGVIDFPLYRVEVTSIAHPVYRRGEIIEHPITWFDNR